MNVFGVHKNNPSRTNPTKGLALLVGALALGACAPAPTTHHPKKEHVQFFGLDRGLTDVSKPLVGAFEINLEEPETRVHRSGGADIQVCEDMSIYEGTITDVSGVSGNISHTLTCQLTTHRLRSNILFFLRDTQEARDFLLRAQAYKTSVRIRNIYAEITSDFPRKERIVVKIETLHDETDK